MSQVIPFQFEEKEVRIIQEGNLLWFVAQDVCKILEHSDASMAVAALDEDEKGTRKVCTPGGQQEMIVISESGLYTLIIRSNKPQAKPFRRWVTHEVLPSIRKTGRYSVDQQSPQVKQLPKPKLESELYTRCEREIIIPLREYAGFLTEIDSAGKLFNLMIDGVAVRLKEILSK